MIERPIRQFDRSTKCAGRKIPLFRTVNSLQAILNIQSKPSLSTNGARALQQLATEDDSRELQPDELRYALGMLEPEQLLPDLPPTVGRIVQTLLTAENRLSQRDLADRTGVSARTIRNYRNRLEASDLIRIDETGYRLALSFQTTSERRDPIVPTVLEENQMLLDAANAFLETLLPPERYGDPDNPLGSVLFWPPDPSRLLENEISSPIMLTIGLMSLFMIIVVLRVFSPAMAVLSPEAAESSIYQFITWRPIFSREKTAVSELIGKGYSDIFGDRISLRTGLDADKVLDMSGESYSQDDIIEYNSGCIKGNEAIIEMNRRHLSQIYRSAAVASFFLAVGVGYSLFIPLFFDII